MKTLKLITILLSVLFSISLTARNAEKVNREGVVQEVSTVLANGGGSTSKIA
ncbi:MAG: hypothetical protein HUU48_00995, partial [Flavobacteriales bacterium]|nr:hypothetical protein [Flavobacteriales bacterium]